MMNKNILASALAFTLVSAQAASANQTLNDQLSFRFGPFFPSIDTNVTIKGAKYNFEDVLDDNATTGSVQALWRVSRKWRLRFGYWAVDRETSESSDQNHNIGGITIPAGSSIGATFESSLANAALGWSFVANDTTDFGVELGIAALSLKSELGASVAGVGNVSFTAFDETYPLPTLGVYLTQSLSPKWSIAGNLNGIGLEIGDDFKGNIINASGAVEFRPWKNVGLGLAYLYSSADAELKNVSDGLNVDWTYQGPFAFVTLGFGEVK